MDIKKSGLRIILATFLLAGTYSPSPTEASSTKSVSNISEYLEYLTNQDRELIKRVNGREQLDGKFLHPGINVHSEQPTSIIVQFQQEPAEFEVKKKAEIGEKLTLQKAKENVAISHQQFKKQIDEKLKINSKRGGQSPIRINREYQSAFNGVAMTLPANEVPKLLQLDSVKAVWKDSTVTVDPEPLSEEQMKESPVMDSLRQIDAPLVHDEGITGKGVKVGVIDTGIDYNHPDIAQAYKGGYDFVDNDDDPMETTYQDWLDAGQPGGGWSGGTYYTSHGTHVAGTIAGRSQNNSEYAVKGVAPEVDLYAYRVLGPFGSGSVSAIIAGIEKAVEDGMDVINLSLGSTINDPLDPTSIAVDNAVQSGTVAVVASGNSGSEGNYSVGSPGSSTLAITVGASDYSVTLPTASGILTSQQTTDQLNGIQLMASQTGFELSSLLDSSLEIVYVNIGYEFDFENKDVEGKIALIARGAIPLIEKITRAKQHGAKGVLMFNDNPEEGHIPYYFGEEKEFIPSFSLTHADGNKVLEVVEQNSPSFTFDTLSEMTTVGDNLAAFSSRGPTRKTYEIKPEVVAPGVSVYSSVPSYMTNPENQDDYSLAYYRASGTSMAAPHVAGAAALLLHANPNLKPEDVKTALMNTSEKLQGDTSVFETGAGRINVHRAIHAEVEIEVKQSVLSVDPDRKPIFENSGDLSFGSFINSGSNMRDQLTVTLNNNSNKKKKFEITFEESKNQGTNSLKTNGVLLNNSKTVTVPANKQMKTNVFLNIPKTAKKGFYEGTFIFTNKDDASEIYRVPFGFILLDEGIDEVIVPNSSFTTRRDLNHGYMGYTPVLFSVDSPMKQLDIVLKDMDTGEGLGIIESYVGDIDEGYIYGMEFGFVGLYFPFSGNPNHPIQESKTLAPPGNYEIEIVTKSAEGKVFNKSVPVFIENTLPNVTMKQPGGVYEVTADGMIIEGNITDEFVNSMKSYGLDYDQSSNMVNLLNSTPFSNTALSISENGDFSAELKLNEGVNSSKITLQTFDNAMNGMQDHPSYTYHLIKQGNPFAKLTAENADISYGETFHMNLSSKNIGTWKSAEFQLNHQNTIFEILEVKVSDELQLLLEEAGLSATLTTGNISNSNIPLTLELSDELDSLTEEFPLIHVKAKVKEVQPFYTKWIQSIKLTAAKFQSSQSQTVIAQAFGQDINILPTVSQLEGGILPEGFLDASGIWLDYTKDFLPAGVKVSAISEDGTRYDAPVNSSVRYTFKDLPLSHQPYTLFIKVPGHFERVAHVSHLADEFNGESVGRMTYIFYGETSGGDIIQDGVIDILDALAIQEHFGTDHRAADINYDGIVNEEDMQYVVKNFLRQNTTLTNPPAPQESKDGITLEKILHDLGI
ncbi:MAG: S8 family serine peptidase [Bacillota bacterium]